MTGQNPRLKAGEVAERCDVSRQTVQSWYNEGLARRPTIDQVLQFLAHRKGYAPESQRERLAREQADRVALENAARRGELMPLADAIAAATEFATDIAARLDAVAGRLANEIPGITDAATARARLLEEHRAIRAASAEHLGALSKEESLLESDAGANRAAAPKDREPVGRRKPTVAVRKRGARKVPK